MRDLRAAWAVAGDAVWNRFRALGIADPIGSTKTYLDGATWIPDQRPVDARKLLLESTMWAIQRLAARTLGAAPPEPAALAAFCCNRAQIERVLATPIGSRPALVLATLDGLDLDEIATALGLTATSVQLALAAVDDELLELASPLPDGSLDAEHVSSIQLHGFAQEALDPLAMQQLEQHMAGCPWCMERFSAWMSAREAFDALPPPAPPPRAAAWVRPIAMGAFGVLALALAGGVALFVMTRVEQAEQAVTWHAEAPTVELRQDGGALPAGTSARPGALLALWVDAHHAPHLAIAREQGDEVEILLSAPVRKAGLQLAPVELLASEGGGRAHVVLGDRPLGPIDVARALDGSDPALTVTTVSW